MCQFLQRAIGWLWMLELISNLFQSLVGTTRRELLSTWEKGLIPSDQQSFSVRKPGDTNHVFFCYKFTRLVVDGGLLDMSLFRFPQGTEHNPSSYPNRHERSILGKVQLDGYMSVQITKPQMLINGLMST